MFLSFFLVSFLQSADQPRSWNPLDYFASFFAPAPAPIIPPSLDEGSAIQMGADIPAPLSEESLDDLDEDAEILNLGDYRIFPRVATGSGFSEQELRKSVLREIYKSDDCIKCLEKKSDRWGRYLLFLMRVSDKPTHVDIQ